VIVQDDAFSVRVAGSGRDRAVSLQRFAQIMADKVTSVSRTKLGRRIGRLNDGDMARLDRALPVFLGLAR
jgi:mRNA-degrading endonuclease toxin of MazEF toxin-antitoxin module